MSNRYTSDGKRKSSMTHARRGWTCACGRTVWGNGGKSSHQRACRTHKEVTLASLEESLDEMASGAWGRTLSADTMATFQRRYEREAAQLRVELGLPAREN